MKIINEDLLKQKGIIVHQVNCRGVMGAGLAKRVREKFPAAYINYKSWCNKFGEKSLGSVQYTFISEDVIVANLFGQNYYGRDKRYTDYDALRSGFKDIACMSKTSGLPVYIPFNMGCRLGGDWSVVEGIIKETLADIEYYLCNYDK